MKNLLFFFNQTKLCSLKVKDLYLKLHVNIYIHSLSLSLYMDTANMNKVYIIHMFKI